MTRFRLAGAVAALALSVLLPGPGQAADPTPKRGGTAILALGADPATLNPNITTNNNDAFIGCMLYDGLVRHAQGFKVVPALAKSWEISEDGLTYKMLLEQAQWQDGKPVTSEDVKFSLLEISSKYGPFFQAPGRIIASIDTPDPLTVVITLKQPFGPFLYSLSCDQNAAVLPAHIFRNTDILSNPATLSAPMGNGPFKLKQWVRGDRVELERNPTYWRKGEPYLDSIIVKVMPNTPARVLALQAGEVDYVDGYYFPLSSVKAIENDKRFQIRATLWPTDDLIILNTKNPPIDNVKVRQALMIALDRNYIQKNVFFGQGDPAASAVDTRLTWAYNPAVDFAKLYPFDPARAAALLTEAGFPPKADGTRFSIRLVFDTGRPEYVQWAQATQRFWQAVGVRLVLEGAERPIVLKRVYTDYDFDATFQAYTTSGDPALGIARLYITDSIKQGATFNNVSRYSNPEVDELFAKGRDASKIEDRARHYFKVQEILAHDVPTLVIHQQVQLAVAWSHLKGLWQASEYQWWGPVWLDK